MFQMKNIQTSLAVGIVSSLLFILLHLTQGIVELLHLQWPYLNFIFAPSISVGNILALIILWVVLVKFYEQIGLDYILKTIIVVSTVAVLLSLVFIWHRVQMVYISMMIIALIDLIFYFIFIFRVINIDHSKILPIDQLKNFGVAFAICMFCQLVLSIVVEVVEIKDLESITHLLMIIPAIFIVLFFRKIKISNFCTFGKTGE